MKYFLLFFLPICYTQFGFCQSIDWMKKANPTNLSINSVAFSNNGQKVISGTNCHPASIRVHEVSSGTLSWDYIVDSNYMCIMGVTFSSNSNYIAAIEEFGNIFIFDNTTAVPTLYNTINTGTSYGFSTAISPSNMHIAVGCSNGKLKIYNIASGSNIANVNAHTSWVTSVAYSADGKFIATGGNDDKVKIWDSLGNLVRTLNGHSNDITSVKFSPNNQLLASASKDDLIKIWDVNSGALLKTISGHSNDVNCIDISPDGNKIVSASSDSTCKIWNINTGNLLSKFGVKDSGVINAVAWSPLGNKIVTGNSLSDLVLWSIPNALFVQEKPTVSTLKLFPNPAKDFIYLDHSLNVPNTKFNIYNNCGKVVLSNKELQSLNGKLDISCISDGIYYLEIIEQSNKISIPFMVKK
jgi:WD40 repeat protein